MKQVEIWYAGANASHTYDLEDAAAEEMVATLSAGRAYRYETTWKYYGDQKWSTAPHVKYPATRVILPWAIASITVHPTVADAKVDLEIEKQQHEANRSA